MEWYYASEGKQFGPISDADFRNLVTAGRITPNTLVWREGMPNWQAFSTAQSGAVADAPGSLSLCVECGKPFAPEDMVQYGAVRVCAACKPIFFQKLKQGADVQHAFVYAGFWIRVVAQFIDGVIMWFVNMATNALLGLANDGSSSVSMIIGFMMVFLNFGLGAAYEVWFLGKFGATPGKMALGLKVIRPDGEKITYLRALARHLAEILSGLILCIGYIMVAFDEEKRALHDRICDTRVIKV
jgi:uncharacterized RDD family membrane protein YckC